MRYDRRTAGGWVIYAVPELLATASERVLRTLGDEAAS